MDKARSSFADDLRVIQGEVEADVDTILSFAKRQRDVDLPVTAQTVKTETPSKPVRRRSQQVQPRRIALPAEEPQAPLLQNVTTRLSHETNGLLTEAALRQRLNKATPNTRQDIIEEAVRDWLCRHGYHNPSG